MIFQWKTVPRVVIIYIGIAFVLEVESVGQKTAIPKNENDFGNIPLHITPSNPINGTDVYEIDRKKLNERRLWNVHAVYAMFMEDEQPDCHRFSCKYKKTLCYCDEVCPVLGDCCFDYSDTPLSEDDEYYFPSSTLHTGSTKLETQPPYREDFHTDDNFHNDTSGKQDGGFHLDLPTKDPTGAKHYSSNKMALLNSVIEAKKNNNDGVTVPENEQEDTSIRLENINSRNHPKDQSENVFLMMIKQYGSCREMQRIGNFTIIDSCPVDYPCVTTSWKCSECRKDDIRNIAASLKHTELPVVFRNKFCAKCHGISKHDLEFWNSTLECSDNITKDESITFIEEKCDLIQWPPGDMPHPRRCIHTDINSCPTGSDEIEQEKCHKFRQPILLSDAHRVVYKNKHCAFCNGYKKEGNFKIDCNDDHKLGSINQVVPAKLGITFLFSFDNDFMTLKSKSGTKLEIPICEIGQSFNAIVQRCMDINCPSNFILDHDRCRFVPHKYFSPFNLDPPIIHIFKRSNEKPSSDDEKIDFVVFMEKNMNCSKGLKHRDFGKLREIVLIGDKKLGDDMLAVVTDCMKSFQIQEKKITNETSDLILQTFENIRYVNCHQGVLKAQKFNISTDEMNLLTVLQDVSIISASFNNSILMEHLHFRIEVIQEELRTLEIWYCENNETHFHDDCEIFFAYDDFHVRGREAEVTAFNMTFEIHDFHIENGTLYSCIHERNETRGQKINLIFEMDNVLTVCFSVSIFSLILVSVIYCALRELRNLHGKCMVSFCVSLAIAHTLWILQGYLSLDCCRPLAIILHFIWLSVFMWTGVMAFDLARKLSVWTIFNSRTSNDQKLFLIYSLIAWISPAVIVGICLIVDEMSDNYIIGYGAGVHINSICWIYNSSARIYAFIVPCGTILLVNFGFLVVVICGLESARCATRKVSKNQKDMSRCVVYTKISVMVGATWILAYISSAVRLSWVDVIYNILNSMQGVLVLLGVLFNCRIMKMFCQKLKVKPPSSRRASSLDTRL